MAAEVRLLLRAAPRFQAADLAPDLAPWILRRGASQLKISHSAPSPSMLTRWSTQTRPPAVMDIAVGPHSLQPLLMGLHSCQRRHRLRPVRSEGRSSYVDARSMPCSGASHISRRSSSSVGPCVAPVTTLARRAVWWCLRQGK